MPKFGKTWFNGYHFGDDTPVYTNYYNSIHRVPLGFEVRKQLAKSIIFRIRRGNGYAGSTAGRRYQDKFKYFVPSSINNAEGEPSRTNFKTAIDYWHNILSADEKQAYHKRSTKGLHMSGYNLFIREAMRGIYHMFVNRGDPANYDFTLTDFTTDGNWHDLNLSAITPTTARLILLDLDFNVDHKGEAIEFRKKTNSNDKNHAGVDSFENNQDRHKQLCIIPNNSQVCEYKTVSENWNSLNMTICGWWT